MESRGGAGGSGAARGMNGAATPAPRARRKKAKPPAQTQALPASATTAARPIPQPYLARAPKPLASSSWQYDPLPSSSNLVLPSSFRRSATSTGAGAGDPGPSTVRNTERERFANGLLAPPTIRAGQTPTPAAGAAGTRNRKAAVRGMGAGNPSMTSLGHLGRILESDPTANNADGERATGQATPAPAPARRRRRIVRGDADEVEGGQGVTPRRRLTVSSREEGRAIGLARGASMRRLNVWDDLPENNDAPPPFPFPTSSTSRLPPTFQSTQSPPIPSSPPPTFAQATGLEPLPHLPALTEEPEALPETARPSSRASTRYMSAPSSPVLTALDSPDDPPGMSEDERADRRMWNADLLAGYTLEERVQREMDRKRAREATVSGEQEQAQREDHPSRATTPTLAVSEPPAAPVIAESTPSAPVLPEAATTPINVKGPNPSPSQSTIEAGRSESGPVVSPAAPVEPSPMPEPSEEATPTKKVGKGKGKTKKAKRRSTTKITNSGAAAEPGGTSYSISTTGTAVPTPEIKAESPEPVIEKVLPPPPEEGSRKEQSATGIPSSTLPAEIHASAHPVASTEDGAATVTKPAPSTPIPPAAAVPAPASTPESQDVPPVSTAGGSPKKAASPQAEIIQAPAAQPLPDSAPAASPSPTLPAPATMPPHLSSTRSLATLREHVESPPLSAEDRILGGTNQSAEGVAGPARKLTRGKAIRRSSSGLIKPSDSPTVSTPLFSAARFDFGGKFASASVPSVSSDADTAPQQPRPFIHRSSAPAIPQAGGRRLGDAPTPTPTPPTDQTPAPAGKGKEQMPAHREAALLRRESILAHFARPPPPAAAAAAAAPATARKLSTSPKTNNAKRLSLPSGPLIDFSDMDNTAPAPDLSVSPSSSNFRSLLNANAELLQLLEDEGEGAAESSAQAAAKAELVHDIRAQLELGPAGLAPDLPPRPAQPVEDEHAKQADAEEEETNVQTTVKKKPPPPPPPLRTKKGAWTAGQKISIVDTASSPITPRPSLRRPGQGQGQVSPTADRLAPPPPLPTRRPPPPPPGRPLSSISSAASSSVSSTTSPPPPRLPPPVPPRPWTRFDRSKPRGPRPPPPTPPRPRTWAKVVSGQPDHLDVGVTRPVNERAHSADTVPVSIHLDAPASQSSMRSISEQDLTSAASGHAQSGRPGARRRPTPEYTDLDVFVSRLEGSGREYEGYSHIAQFLGPAKSPAASSDALSTLLPGPIVVESRRTTKEGKVKLKLSLLGVRVTKCPICLAQFRDQDLGVLLPQCGHLGHEACARRWFREDDRCFVCRVKLKAPEGVV